MLDDAIETKIRKEHAVDRIGGSLVNVILGALILWVGQTTFRHAGLLASVNERFDSVGHQFNAVDGRHESLRRRLEQVTAETTERTRSRFTREDGEKMMARIEELQVLQNSVERQLTDRVTGLQLKLIALETNGNNSQEVARLRAEVQALRQQAGRGVTAFDPPYVGTASGTAGMAPVQLPPVARRQ